MSHTETDPNLRALLKTNSFLHPEGFIGKMSVKYFERARKNPQKLKAYQTSGLHYIEQINPHFESILF